MIGLFSALLAAAVVAVVLMVMILDRRTAPPKGQRIGLSLLAAGLVWAGPARMLGVPAGLGDAVFLLGLLVLLLALYGPALARKADAIDGRLDGRLGAIPLHRGAFVVGAAAPDVSALKRYAAQERAKQDRVDRMHRR